jgi:outer membrane protein assembly factor BamA
LLLPATVLALTACNSTRRLKDGEYLLDKNHIVVTDKSSAHEVPVWDLDDVVKQQPNRRIFKVKFHLWVYNRVNPHKLDKKKQKRAAKLERKNQRRLAHDIEKLDKRIARGKDSSDIRKPITSPGFAVGWREWIRNTVGEAPVILDSSKTRKSVDQIHLVLVKRGFFNNTVTDSIVYHKRKPKAQVYYKVKSGIPYRIKSIRYDIPDSDIERYVRNAVREDSLIRYGDIFNIDVLDDERERLTTYFHDRGYYGFTKDYIYFKVDSALNSHQVEITLGVANPTRKERVDGEDHVVEFFHQRFFINNIYVFTDYDANNRRDDISGYDSVRYQEVNYLYVIKPSVKPEVLASTIFIGRGSTYREKEVEATQKQLSSLGVYKSINIRFTAVEGDSTGTLMDAYIILIPNKTQFVQLESDATVSGHNYGIQGSFNYTHKNLFRGAEKLKFRIAGGLEVQQLFTNQDDNLTEGGTIDRINPFNTLEVGPELSLEIPKLIFVNRRWVRKWLSQSTAFKATVNYQQRPDFKRGLQDVSLILAGHPNTRVTHNLSLLKISALEIDPSPAFEERLEQLNDAVMKAAYQDHIISGLQYSFTYNDQGIKRQLHNFFYRGTFSSAGNTLRAVFNMVGATPDSLNSYRLFGIRFAQFVKTTQELRWYQNYNEKSQMVFRVAGGIGIPLTNLKEAIPFEESLFAGGSNGIRGWRARSLGPGGYLDTTFVRAFDRIGDVHMEGNIEYRFDLLDIIEGALFVDAGNIWLLRPTTRTNGQFSKDFWKQIALSGGIGLRADVDFFIIRLDAALQMYDPSLPGGERWLFQKKDQINAIRSRADERDPSLDLGNYRPKLVLNFGLGYPF